MKTKTTTLVLNVFLIVALAVPLAVPFVVEAGGGAGLAKEYTQLLNKAELITQVAQLAEQIDDMIFNTEDLALKLGGEVTGAVAAAINAYNTSQRILARLSNIDQEFYSRFYSEWAGSKEEWIENYAEKYYELSVEIDEEAERRLKSLKITADDIDDSNKLLEKLNANSDGAEGRNALVKAGNEFMAFMSGELVKMRTLVAEQTKVYLDYAERNRAAEDAAFDLIQDDVEKWKAPVKINVEYDW